MTNKRTGNDNCNSDGKNNSNVNGKNSGNGNGNGKNNLLSHHKPKGQATVVGLIPPHSDERNEAECVSALS
jgi:hypothetical protein